MVEVNWNQEQKNTLVKSTENLSSDCKIKAPFSYNQLNCSAWPFLTIYLKHEILVGDQEVNEAS